MRNLWLALLFLAAYLHPAQALYRPPTPDPTYGLPVPAIHKAQTVGSPAQWIWAAQTRNNQTVYFRKIFTLTKVRTSANLYVTCDDFFTAYVNGHPVAHSSPEPNNDFVWKQVHRVDVTQFLHSGKNLLAIEGKNAGGAAGLVAMLDLGKKRVIATDRSWLCSERASSNWRSDLSAGAGWNPISVEGVLNSGPWENSLVGWPGYSSIPYYLAQLPIWPVHVTILNGTSAFEKLSNLTVKNGQPITVHLGSANGSTDQPALLIDFGRELAGEIQIASDSSQPIQVILATGESAGEALNSPWQGPLNLTVAPGSIADGRHSAFRYAKLTFVSGPPTFKIRFVHCNMIYYPVRYQGSFDCSDPLLTRIWYVGAYTAHLCMQDDIWDAPKRDRARWMGDLQVSGETINDAFGDRFLMEQTMNRLRADAGNPPHSHVNGIPGYSCAWVVGMTDFYKHIGDLNYIRRHRDDLIQMMDFFKAELDSRGLFANKRKEWDFCDWSPGFNGGGPHSLAATHFYMVKMLRDGAWLLDQIGDHTDAERFHQWAQQAIQAAQRYLLNPSTDTFGDRWQDNAMAIYSGTATPSERKAIWDDVLSHLYPVNEMITPYYNYYDIWAMSEAGHTRQAINFIRWFWGGMIKEGATTFWEGYDPRWPKQHFHKYLQADNGMGYFVSLSHGWSSGPTSFLSERVLGLRPIGGGFSTVLIKPELGGLSWAKGGVPTPHGILYASYRVVNGRLNATIKLPDHEIATVSLPGRSAHLRVNGRTIASRIVGDRSEIVLKHGGRYTIE